VRSDRISSPPRCLTSTGTSRQIGLAQSGAGGPPVAAQHFVSGADVSARWWAAFKSPQLNALIKLSVEHNPTLQSAEAAIKVAQYNALAQRGLFFPQLTGNSTSSNQLFSNAGSVFGAPLDSVPQSQYSLVTNQLSVSFVPDIWAATSGPSRAWMRRRSSNCSSSRPPI